MLDDVGRVADHPGNENAPFRKLQRLPELPFVFMPRICRLDRISADVELEQQPSDGLERNVPRVGHVLAAPANMIAHAFRGYALERLIAGLNPHLGPAE